MSDQSKLTLTTTSPRQPIIALARKRIKLLKRLYQQIEAAKPATKTETLLKLIKRQRGATLAELQKATGWQAHSVRGAISGILRIKLGLVVSYEDISKRGCIYCVSQSAEHGASE